MRHKGPDALSPRPPGEEELKEGGGRREGECEELEVQIAVDGELGFFGSWRAGSRAGCSTSGFGTNFSLADWTWLIYSRSTAIADIVGFYLPSRIRN